MNWTELVKKYNMVNGPRYYDSRGTVVKRILNQDGATIVQIDKDGPKEFCVSVEKLGKNKSSFKRYDNIEKIDVFLSKLDLVCATPKADDKTILKFLSHTYMVRIKSIEDLVERFRFIKWPDAIELKDYEIQAVYAVLVNGDRSTGEIEGLAPLGMTVNEMQDWLLSKGVTKAKKPPRHLTQSLYD